MEAIRKPHDLSRFEQLRFAQEVLRAEGEAVLSLADSLSDSFCEAVDLLFGCRGCVVVTGMGKAGLIGQKLSATFASTGTPSQYLHPAEAVHGDLGRVQPGDVVVALSFSGETEELVRILPSFRRDQTPVVAITANGQSTLASHAAITLLLGVSREACPLGLAPTTSTTTMLALGDALALGVSRLRQFRPEDFARFHPGGNLGRQLAIVDDVMRKLSLCRLASHKQPVREVLVSASKPGRRTGAIMLVDEQGRLRGVFTDSDLARLLENRNETALDEPIESVMTHAPASVPAGSLMTAAVKMLIERRISELPVVDDQARPVGLIDITDVVAWLPPPSAEDSGSVEESAPFPVVVPFSNRRHSPERT